jgi:hypothetical protein
MANKYGLSEKELDTIRKRDVTCVYCHKKMTDPKSGGPRSDWSTIEHLNPISPWDDPITVSICCFSCNASRGQKTLLEWFKNPYCLEKNINEQTVTEPVRWYLRLFENFIDKINWTFAKTMAEIPHYYIVRDNLLENEKKEFDELSSLINEKGIYEQFQMKQYKYLRLGKYKYWVIDNVINRVVVNKA